MSGELAALSDAQAFSRWAAQLHECEWVVYAKRPFAGPEAVLAYLSRYTHRVAISNPALQAHLAAATETVTASPMRRQGTL